MAVGVRALCMVFRCVLSLYGLARFVGGDARASGAMDWTACVRCIIALCKRLCSLTEDASSAANDEVKAVVFEVTCLYSKCVCLYVLLPGVVQVTQLFVALWFVVRADRPRAGPVCQRSERAVTPLLLLRVHTGASHP